MIITLAIIGFSALLALVVYLPWRREIQRWFSAGKYKQNKFLITAIGIVVLVSGLTLYFVLSTNRSPEAGLGDSPVSEQKQPANYSLELGTSFPPLSLPDTEGNIIDLNSLSEKFLVLSFLNSQCQYCSQQLEELRNLSAVSEFGGEIVLINVLEPVAMVRDYKISQAITFPILIDTEGKTLVDYQIKGIPTTFFIRQGVICGQLPGQVSVAELQSSLQACEVIIPFNN